MIILLHEENGSQKLSIWGELNLYLLLNDMKRINIKNSLTLEYK